MHASPGDSAARFAFADFVRQNSGTRRAAAFLILCRHDLGSPGLKIWPFGPIKNLTDIPMNWLPRTIAPGRPAATGGFVSHVVPVRDVQWGRPVFRPPALPAYPRLFNTVPFTAMRPLRPTSREKHETSY